MHAVNGIPFQTIYDQAHLQALGATFDEFISDPRGTLERVGQSDAPEIIERGHRPLLPAQVRLRRQWIQGWQANGTWDDRQQQIPQQRGTPVRLLPAAVTLAESPRVLWRPLLLREWSHEQVHEVFP